jgi:predicted aspartyl protease
MGKIVLPYQLKQDHRGHWSLLPLAQVIMFGRTRSVPVTAVVDSGATHPFFPRSAAEDAGIELQNAQRVHTTFGGSETIGLLKEA